MKRSAPLFAALVVVLVGTPLAAQEVANDAPPVVELYAQSGKINNFVKDAIAYVRAHADSPHVPRILGELLMLGKVAGREEIERDARIALLMAHGRTVSGRYALVTIKDAKACRNLLETAFDRLPSELRGTMGAQWTRAVAAAVSHFGPDVLRDRAFALKCALVARSAGNAELQALARQAFDKLAKDDPDSRRLGDACLSADMAPKDRFLAVRGLAEAGGTRAIERILYAMIGEDAQQTPEVREAYAEMLLESRRVAEAMPILEELVKTRADARLLFHLGRCRLCTGEYEAGQADLERLRRDFADSPWAEAAGQLLAAAPGIKERLTANAAAISEAFLGYTGTDFIEARIRIEGAKPKVPADVYLLSAPEQGVFAMQYRDAGRLVLAYETMQDGWRLLSAEDETIYVISGKPMYMAAHFAVNNTTPGELGFSFAGNLVDSKAKAQKALRYVVDREHFGTKRKAAAFLDLLVRHYGVLPEAIEGKDGLKRYVWLQPGVREAVCSRCGFAVDANGKLVELDLGSVRIERLRYGRAEGKLPEPADWPDLKRVRISEPAEMVKVFGKLMLNMVRIMDPDADEGTDSFRL